MFDEQTAGHLRDALRPIDFSQPSPDDEALEAYVSHYGLKFSDLSFTVQHSLGAFDSGHFRLAGQYFAVPLEHQAGTIVIVHGYYDHVGLYSRLIHHCLGRGFSVLAFDLPGHGLSSGEPASIESFDLYSQALADFLKKAQEQGIPRPWHVIAQSTGAAAVTNYLIKDEQFSHFELEKIIFLAPLIRPNQWGRQLFKYLLVRLFVTRVKREFTDNSHDEEFLEFIAQRDPLQTQYLMADWVRSLRFYLAVFKQAKVSQRVLHVIQGTSDETVDWRYNLPRLTERFPEMKTYIIDRARHHLVNESTEFRDKVFSTIDAILEE